MTPAHPALIDADDAYDHRFAELERRAGEHDQLVREVREDLAAIKGRLDGALSASRAIGALVGAAVTAAIGAAGLILFHR